MATVATELEVKDCPLCGSEARMKTAAGAVQMNKGGAPVVRTNLFWVKCSNLDCAASHVSKPSVEEAAAAWNQRA